SRLVPVTTECLLTSVAAVLLLLLVPELHARPRPHWRPVAYGAVVGFGVAVKLTFAPLALVPAAVLRTRREAALYAVSIVGSFVLSTAPIWSQYQRLALWVMDLITHQGPYGHGPAGMMSLSTWLTR